MAMPPLLPGGEVLTDGYGDRIILGGKQWVTGSFIGKGGSGEIYLATPKGGDMKNAEHVIKIVS